MDPRDAGRRGAALREAGNPDVTVRLFPGVSHAPLRDPDGNPGREMYLYRVEVAPEVMGALTEWLARRLGPGEERPADRGRGLHASLDPAEPARYE